MTSPAQSGQIFVGDVSASLESLAADAVDLQEQINELRHGYTQIADKVHDLEDAIGTTPPTDPPTDPVDPGTDVPDVGTPPSKATDLDINVSHYRFTYGIRPDNTSPTGYTIQDKRLVQLYGQFPVVRVMNWTAQVTSRSRNITWSDRITADDFDKWDTPNGSGATGLPIEALIQFANECGSTLMWTFPQQCDNNFMYEAGKLFAALYEQDELIIEGPNEVWDKNRGWHFHKQAGGDFGKAMELYARTCADRFAAFVFGYADGGGEATIHRFIGGQLHNPGVLSLHILPKLSSTEYDGFLVSGYFGDMADRPGDYVTGDGGYNHTMKCLDDHARIAQQFNTKMGIYEVNSSIIWGQDDYSVIDSFDVQTRLGNVVAKCRNLKCRPIPVYSGVGDRFCAGDPDANFPVYGTDYQPQSPVVETLGLPTISGGGGGA